VEFDLVVAGDATAAVRPIVGVTTASYIKSTSSVELLAKY